MKNLGYLLCICLLMAGCNSSSTENNGIRLVATTGIIGNALENIVGDSVEVISLMGPGVDPHLYKATQGDLQRLTSADVVFYNGLHLEGKMGDILERLGRTKSVIAVTSAINKKYIRKVPEFNNSYDPHVWFDVSLWSETVKLMNEELGKLYPANKDYFEANTKSYISALDSLHTWVIKTILEIPEKNRILITAHDAFGYFGDAYGIHVRGLQGISTMSDFGLKDITDLVSYITSNNVKAVFIETSVSERAINAVVEGCEQRGFPITVGGYLYSDAMGDPNSPEGTYIGMVKANVLTIKNALQ